MTNISIIYSSPTSIPNLTSIRQHCSQRPTCILKYSHTNYSNGWSDSVLLLLKLITHSYLFVRQIFVELVSLKTVSFSLTDLIILFSILFSNILSIFSFPRLRGQVSHPRKTSSKNYSFVYLNLLSFQMRNRNVQDSELNGSIHSSNLICSQVPERNTDSLLSRLPMS